MLKNTAEACFNGIAQKCVKLYIFTKKRLILLCRFKQLTVEHWLRYRRRWGRMINSKTFLVVLVYEMHFFVLNNLFSNYQALIVKRTQEHQTIPI